jgi:hypothetical protein
MTNANCLRAPAILAALTALLLTLTATIPSAFAAKGGYTNYVPGLYGDFAVSVPPDPGFYLRQDLYYYTADGDKAWFVQGEQIRAELDLDVGCYLLTGFMVTDFKLLGGRYAFGADIPIVFGSIAGTFAADSTVFSFDEDRTAFGDLGLIPISLYWSFGNFHFNVYESVIVPTGSYDASRAIDAGLNHWSFDTVVGATYLHPEKGFELSAVLGYIYNTENTDIDYQTGQEIHLDVMVNQFLSETVAVGIQGFYYKQVTGDSGRGAVLGDFKGEAAGIGPAVMWATQIKEVGLFVNFKWLYEFHAENRLEGNHFFVNATLAF